MLSSSANRNTLEYRKEISKAARQLVPDILAEAGGMSSWQDILNGFKARRPDLSDDALPCQCGNRHPQWEHCVATAMQGLKRAQVVEHPARGVWRLATGLPSVPKPPLAPASPITAQPPISGQPAPTPVAPRPPAEPPARASLLELIRVHLEEVKRGLAQRIADLSADQFEQFVAEFLTRQGYSDVRCTGGPGDRNVDVTATYGAPFVEVPLRVQVKHRQRGGTVGPSDVAAFRDRAGGVDRVLLMVTNERLGPAALDTASEQGRQRVHVVQGDDLLDAMIDKRIGVKEGPFALLEIDEEFFAQF